MLYQIYALLKFTVVDWLYSDFPRNDGYIAIFQSSGGMARGKMTLDQQSDRDPSISSNEKLNNNILEYKLS